MGREKVNAEKLVGILTAKRRKTVVPKRLWSWTVFWVPFLKMGKASIYLDANGKDPEEGKEIIGRVWFPGWLRPRTPEGLDAEKECTCRWLCHVGVKLREREGFYFLCEVGARFFAVNWERCAGMRGLRKIQKVWNSSCVEWRDDWRSMMILDTWNLNSGTASLWGNRSELRLEFKESEIRYGDLGLLDTLN